MDQIPNSLGNLFAAISQAIATHRQKNIEDTQRAHAEEDRQRGIAQGGVENFLKMLPYQSSYTPGQPQQPDTQAPNPLVSDNPLAPKLPFLSPNVTVPGAAATPEQFNTPAVPQQIQAFAKTLGLDLSKIQLPSAIQNDLRTNAEAGATSGVRTQMPGVQLQAAKQGIQQGDVAIRAGEQGILNSQLDAAGKSQALANAPVTTAVEYAHKIAPNYVSAALATGIPLDRKNMDKIINESWKQFQTNAPDSPFKSALRRQDFADAVTEQLVEQQKLAIQKAAAERRDGQDTSVTRLMGAYSNIASGIGNKIKEWDKANDMLLTLSSMGTDKLTPEQKTKFAEREKLVHDQDLMTQTSATIGLGQPPSAKAAALIQQYMSGADAGAAKPTGNTIEDSVAQIKSFTSTKQEALINANVSKGNITPADANAMRRMLGLKEKK